MPEQNALGHVYIYSYICLSVYVSTRFSTCHAFDQSSSPSKSSELPVFAVHLLLESNLIPPCSMSIRRCSLQYYTILCYTYAILHFTALYCIMMGLHSLDFAFNALKRLEISVLPLMAVVQGDWGQLDDLMAASTGSKERGTQP